MPAPAPLLGETLSADLMALGARIRARRKALGINATAASEAAGMSRVTWHRIERGEPSVTMGAYFSAIAALGLRIELADPQARNAGTEAAAALPPVIALADYPQLKRLAWQLHGATELTPKDALDLYERNWRHVDRNAMEPREMALVQALVNTFGGRRLLV